MHYIKQTNKIKNMTNDKEQKKLDPEILEEVEKIADEIEGDVKSDAKTNLDEEEEAIDKLKENISNLEEKFLLARADAENARRRARIDVEEARKYSVSGFAKDLIEVGENLQRALDNISADALENDETLKNFADGIVMTKQSMLTIFEKNGIKRVAPEAGEKFDHNVHQAMAQVENEEYSAGEIVDLYQAGYTIHGRLLKPAMVTVAKKS